MKIYTKNIVLVLGIILLVSVLIFVIFANSQDNPIPDPNSDIESADSNTVDGNYTVNPVVHEDLLNIFVQSENSGENKYETLMKFIGESSLAKKMETIAYCLKEDQYTYMALESINMDVTLQNKSLAPYLAETIQKSEGQNLMTAAQAAKTIPEPIIIDSLLKHAVESDYSEPYLEGPSGGVATRYYNSVFEEAAETLYIISDGKIGSDNIPKYRLIFGDEKQALIQQWRQTWQEEINKSN